MPAPRTRRAEQVRAIADHVDHSHLPPIVCGDFNARPESDEIRLMEGVLTAPAVPGPALVDAWRWADDRRGGHTWDPVNPYVAATSGPSARIDYVLC